MPILLPERAAGVKRQNARVAPPRSALACAGDDRHGAEIPPLAGARPLAAADAAVVAEIDRERGRRSASAPAAHAGVDGQGLAAQPGAVDAVAVAAPDRADPDRVGALGDRDLDGKAARPLSTVKTNAPARFAGSSATSLEERCLGV